MKNILCTNCNNTGDNVLVYAPDQITPEMMMESATAAGLDYKIRAADIYKKIRAKTQRIRRAGLWRFTRAHAKTFAR